MGTDDSTSGSLTVRRSLRLDFRRRRRNGGFHGLPGGRVLNRPAFSPRLPALLALDAATGTAKRETPAVSTVAETKHGASYTRTRDAGWLAAFERDTGTLRWKVEWAGQESMLHLHHAARPGGSARGAANRCLVASDATEGLTARAVRDSRLVQNSVTCFDSTRNTAGTGRESGDTPMNAIPL